MWAFLAGLAAVVAISVAASFALETVQRTVDTTLVGPGARIEREPALQRAGSVIHGQDEHAPTNAN